MKDLDYSKKESKGSWFGERDEQSNEAAEERRRMSSEENLRYILSQVEQTLYKLDEGTYGLCDSCGRQIAIERLEALPQASLCVECKTKSAKA